MRILCQAIDQPNPDPANLRRHSNKQIGQSAHSFRAFRSNVPILIDRNGNVIPGYDRLASFRELGWSEARRCASII